MHRFREKEEHFVLEEM